MLADDVPPPVQVSRVDEDGILLEDGLRIPGPCIFYEGKVFLWDLGYADGRSGSRKLVTKEAFGMFEAVLPRPGESLRPHCNTSSN
jgi:NADH dehydrogenase [ubiquinone] 1 alpha subcomplex assembly factor 3